MSVDSWDEDIQDTKFLVWNREHIAVNIWSFSDPDWLLEAKIYS